MTRIVALGAITFVFPFLSACGAVGHREQALAGAASRNTDAVAIGDKDNDMVGDADLDNNDDNDSDAPLDYKKSKEGRFYDKDDAAVIRFGRAAPESERNRIVSLVKRFYLSLARRDNDAACSLLQNSIARAVPEDYGGAAGPSFLRGLKSCGAIISKMVRARGRSLDPAYTPVEVVGVRTGGDLARVLLRFSPGDPRQLSVSLDHGQWKIAAILDEQLP